MARSESHSDDGEESTVSLTPMLICLMSMLVQAANQTKLIPHPEMIYRLALSKEVHFKGLGLEALTFNMTQKDYFLVVSTLLFKD